LVLKLLHDRQLRLDRDDISPIGHAQGDGVVRGRELLGRGRPGKQARGAQRHAGRQQAEHGRERQRIAFRIAGGHLIDHRHAEGHFAPRREVHQGRIVVIRVDDLQLVRLGVRAAALIIGRHGDFVQARGIGPPGELSRAGHHRRRGGRLQAADRHELAEFF
jgi:hypothetical protein